MSSLGFTRESASGATSCQYRTTRSERAPSESISLKAASRLAASKRSRGASKVTSWPALACAAGAASSSAARRVRGIRRRRWVITERDTLAAPEVPRPVRFRIPSSRYVSPGRRRRGHPHPSDRRGDRALRRRRAGRELRRGRRRRGRDQGCAVPPLRLQGRPRRGGLQGGGPPPRRPRHRGLLARHGPRAADGPHRRLGAPVHLAHPLLPAARLAAHDRGDGAPGAGRHRPPRPAQPARVHDRPRPPGPARRLRPRRAGPRGRRADRQRRPRRLPRPSTRAAVVAAPVDRQVPLPHGGPAVIDFTVPPELQELLTRVKAYIAGDVLPAEADIADPDDILGSWEVVQRLRDRARERGIFAPHLPEEFGGLGVGVLGMALISQEVGAAPLAALGMNCRAPDEGNMHTLLLAGTEEQQERWLRPLGEGTIRSCFAMTEPDVASSDPTNLETTAVRDGGELVLNGRKWCITGAIGAAFSIVVAKTGSDSAAGHRNYSLIIVPTDTPGWAVERDPEWIGSHSPGGHPIITLTDVRVPVTNLMGAEGEGFVIAQKRLAGGRLAHAMRWIGMSQRALDLSTTRLLQRKAFGKELARHQMLQAMIADSAMDLYAARLMVLHTAYKLEHGLPHRQEVAMTKTFVSEAFGRIADRAVQIHGAAGIALDLPVGRIYQDARAARIYDGASEVHRMTIARELLKLAMAGESTKAATGDLA